MLFKRLFEAVSLRVVESRLVDSFVAVESVAILKTELMRGDM